MLYNVPILKNKIMTEKSLETSPIEEELEIYGALILHLEDITLRDEGGDVNFVVPTTNPGYVTFMDHSTIPSTAVTVSRYGVTLGIAKRQLPLLNENLENNVFSIKLLEFVPAEKDTGIISKNYSLKNAKKISSHLSGVSLNKFQENDSRFDK